MRNFKWCSLILGAVALLSCAKDLPSLEGVDPPMWKEDRNGCSGRRSSMKAAILREKEKLLATDEMQVVELLGMPDRQELLKRNQKFYYYFMEPAAGCDSGTVESPEKLVIRFNATGLVKSVLVE